MALHLALEGDGPCPWEWWISRVCEEFACLPSEAARELARVPVGLIDVILEARAYARAKQVYDQAQSKKDLPRSPWIEQVKAIEFALVQQAREAERDG